MCCALCFTLRSFVLAFNHSFIVTIAHCRVKVRGATSIINIQLINCCDFTLQGDLEGAKAQFLEATSIEPYCVEAIYNVGLVHLRLDDPEVCVCVC